MITAAIADVAQRDPTRRAIGDARGWLNYAELDAHVARLAHALAERGIGPGAVVGLWAARDRLVPAAICAIWSVGAAYVAIDPRWPAARIHYVLEDSGARHTVTADDPAMLLEQVGTDHGVLDISRATWHGAVHAASLGAPGLAYILYTSGSTGSPKGVEITRRNVAALFGYNRDWAPMGAHDVGIAFHSLTFDVSVWDTLRPLASGAAVLLCDQRMQADPGRVLSAVLEHRASHLCMTPTAFRAFQASAVERGEPTGLREVFLCGERLTFADLEPWFDLHDEHTRLWNVYGPTETCVYSTAFHVREQHVRDEPGSLIGTALGHVKVAIGDPGDDGAGEIVISGPGVARGYHNRPEQSNAVFEHGATSSYRTGDVGRRRSTGDLEYLGRRDSQVKLRGYRVELEEIETAARRHPLVRDCVAVVSSVGRGDEIVLGVVGGVGDRDLRLFLATTLPTYMIPSRTVRLDSLPATSSGKLDRRTALDLLNTSAAS